MEQYAWPGPFQVALPSGDEVTVMLYHQQEKGEAPIVLIDNKRLEEFSHDALADLTIPSRTSAEDLSFITAMAEQVVQAAASYFVRGPAGNPERKAVTLSFTPGVLRARGFVPVTPGRWEIFKSRRWWEGL